MNPAQKVLTVFSACLGFAVTVPAQDLTALQILQRVDDALYSAKDKDVVMQFVLIDRNGKESTREVALKEKGADRRIVLFTSPADQKGIGLLSLPGDVMYLYLPAFGKTRRIASHVKNTNFAGTDLTYENMEPKRYTAFWNAEFSAKDSISYTLLLTPKPGTVTDYSKLIVKVRRDSCYPTRVDYFNKAGENCKVLTREKIEKIGNYWEARETIMDDLKARHKTKLVLVSIKYDTGISNDAFSERYLIR
jgi:hypothetical protein